MRKNDYGFRYRGRNWRDYNRALVARGRLTFWFDDDAIAGWRNTELRSGPGTPQDLLGHRDSVCFGAEVRVPSQPPGDAGLPGLRGRAHEARAPGTRLQYREPAARLSHRIAAHS